MSERKPGEGRLSSEFRKAKRAEVVGFVLLLVGLGVALFGLVQVGDAGAIGVGLAAVGAYLVAHTGAAYASSRGSVKAAALQPPASVVQPAIKLNSPRGL